MYALSKRCLDLSIALLSPLLLCPVLLVVLLLMILFQGFPLLYRQKRVGEGGTFFTLFKLRTMAVGEARDIERLTIIGSFLRSFSIDEIPGFWNVIRGEMSLVGPRPLLPEYLPLYNREQSRRHEVRPGVTGWAQVNGRNAITWQERFELDLWYIENRSFWLDLKILALTLLRVLQRKGIRQEDHASMEPFRGNEGENP